MHKKSIVPYVIVKFKIELDRRVLICFFSFRPPFLSFMHLCSHLLSTCFMYGPVLDFGDQPEDTQAPAVLGVRPASGPYGLEPSVVLEGVGQGERCRGTECANFSFLEPRPVAFKAVACPSKTLRPEGRESAQFVFHRYSGEKILGRVAPSKGRCGGRGRFDAVSEV